MNVYRGHGGICPLNLCSRWRWVDLAPYPVTLYVWMFTEVQEVVFSLEMVVCENCISWHSLLSRSSATLHLVRRPAQRHLFIECALHRLFMLCALTATVSVSSSLCSLSSKMAHTVNTSWCVFRKCLVQNWDICQLYWVFVAFSQFLQPFADFILKISVWHLPSIYFFSLFFIYICISQQYISQPTSSTQ